MDRYWILGTGNWNDTAHWSTESGGAGGASVPWVTDNVFITPLSGFGSGGTITLNGIYYSCRCLNFTSNSGHNYTIKALTSDISIYGSAVFESGLTWYAYTWTLFVSSTTGRTITSNGCTLYYVSFGDQGASHLGAGGGWSLLDNMVVSNYFYTENGTFNANGHNVKALRLNCIAKTGCEPTIRMGSGTWELTDSVNINYSETNGKVVTIICETSTIKLTYAGFSVANFLGGGKTYYRLWVVTPLTGYAIIYGSNTFYEIIVDPTIEIVRFYHGTTTTVTLFNATGTPSQFLTLSNDLGSEVQFNLNKLSGFVDCDYLDISNSNAAGGAAWYAGSHSINRTNNTGWIFADAPYVPSYLLPDRNKPTGYHCFISQFIRNMLAGYIPLKKPDGTQW